MEKFKYKAFISYSHRDSAWAEWLMKALETYRVPRSLIGRVTTKGPIPKKLYPLFRDRDELPADERMTDRLFEAIRSSEFMIVICSPGSATSDLVNREIAEFKRVRGNQNILSMIVDGTPFADATEQECFPQALLHSFDADGAKAGLSAEGLAADVRPHGDGKKMGLMKLVAGILGVGLNDLVRREENRRFRRIVLGSIAASTALIAMATLTYNAVRSEEKAVAAQTIAETRADELEAARRQGEELMQFLANSVYEGLEDAGNIEALKQVAERVLKFYEDWPDLSTVDEVVQSRTVALFRLGQTLERMGDTNAAEQVFDNALSQTRRAFALRPDHPVVTHRHQIALFFSGYLDERLGRFEKAREKYEERVEVTKHGLAIDPGSEAWDEDIRAARTWRDQIAEAELTLGLLKFAYFEEKEEGLTLMRQAYDVRKELYQTMPDKARRMVRLAAVLGRLGNSYLGNKQIELSKQAFEEQEALYLTFLKDYPDNPQLLRYVNDARHKLADVAREEGEFEKAKELLVSTTNSYAKLAEADAENTAVKYSTGLSGYKLSDLLFEMEDYGAADKELLSSLGRLQSVLEKDSRRPSRRLVFNKARLLKAKLLNHQGNTNNSRAILDELEQALMQEAEHIRRLPAWKTFEADLRHTREQI